MKKKIILLILLLVPTFVNANEVKKGDLRCPSNNNCKEITENGVVTRVEITTSDENLRVVKVVEKTNELGVYNVYFKVYGSNNTIKTVKKDVKIVVVVDASSSVVYFYNDGVKGGVTNKNCKPYIPNGAKSFARTFDKNENVSLALIKFNKTSKILRNFSTANFDKVNFGRVATDSYLYLALRQAKTLLEGSTAKNYVVILGDGRYYNDELTESYSIATELRNKGVNIYTIGYEMTSQAETKLINIAGNKNHYFKNTDLAKIETEFLKVASSIETEIENNNINVKTYVDDKLGEEFTIKDTMYQTKRMFLNSINQSGVTSEIFKIEIDKYAKTAWHQTNNGFSLTYADKNGNIKEIRSDVNPEVYWVQQSTTIKSCSGTSLLDNIKSGVADNIGSYYTKICEEGYYENSAYKNGFSTKIVVNDLLTDVKEFNLQYGLGFPIDVEINTNVKCTYKFDTTKFINDYQKIVNSLKTSKNNYEIASLTKDKNEMDNLLNTYINAGTNDLDSYKERFINQIAKLTVKYNDSKTIEYANFINKEEPNTLVTCSNVQEATINNKKVVVNKTCHSSFAKKMTLPEICLSMKTGEMIECNDTTKSIEGGVKFYTRLKQTGAKIYVDILDTTINEKINIKLEDCSYNSKGNINDKATFRQIDLTDPFLQTYTNKTRYIGENYKNTKYDFTKIIKPTIWEEDYSKYAFKLTKMDVYNINLDTSLIGDMAFLGKECFINRNKEYVCNYIKNEEMYKK